MFIAGGTYKFMESEKRNRVQKPHPPRLFTSGTRRLVLISPTRTIQTRSLQRDAHSSCDAQLSCTCPHGHLRRRVASKAVVLKAWLLDQKHEHHLKMCLNYQDLLNRKLSPPSDSEA